MDLRGKGGLDYLPTFRGPKGGSMEIYEASSSPFPGKSEENSEKSPSLRISIPLESSEKEGFADHCVTENTDLEESDTEGQLERKMQTLNSARTSSRGTARCPSYSPSNRSATPKSALLLRSGACPSPLLSTRTTRNKCPLILDLTSRLHPDPDKTLSTSTDTSRSQVLKQLAGTIYPHSNKTQPVKPTVNPEKDTEKTHEDGNLREIYESMEAKLRAQIAELAKNLMETRENKLESDKQIITLRAKIDSEAANYQAKLQSANTTIDSLLLKNTHLEAKLTHLRDEITKSEISTSQVNHDSKQTREQVYIKERENEQLKAQCEMMKNTISELRTNERNLILEIANLKEKVEMMEVKWNSETRSSRLKQRNVDYETEELMRDKEKLQGIVSKTIDENEKMRVKVATLSKKLAFSKSDEQEAKENVDSYQMENTHLKAALVKLERNNCDPRCSQESTASPNLASPISKEVRLNICKRNADLSSQYRWKLTKLQEDRTQVCPYSVDIGTNCEFEGQHAYSPCSTSRLGNGVSSAGFQHNSTKAETIRTRTLLEAGWACGSDDE